MSYYPGISDRREHLSVAGGLAWLEDYLGFAHLDPKLRSALEGFRKVPAWADLRQVSADLENQPAKNLISNAFLAWRESDSLHHLVKHGIPLGPLAYVQVYATDAYGRYDGSSHAHGCQHAPRLHLDHDLLPLIEFVDILTQQRATVAQDQSNKVFFACRKCGGYRLRKLTEEQLQYWDLTLQVADDLESLKFYKRTGGLDSDRAGQHIASMDRHLSGPEPLKAFVVKALREARAASQGTGSA